MEDQGQDTNLEDLNDIQREGIVRYDLTREQVSSPNFGQHTLTGMRTLQIQDANLTSQAAFNMVSGMNLTQINGVTQYNLNRAQVETPNFGNHTLNGLLTLRFQGVPMNQAFNRVSGLENIAQVRGVTEFNLTRNEVQSANFGDHTITGLEAIETQAQQLGINFNPGIAFAQLNGLNEPQVVGFTTYGLTQGQIHSENFGQHTLTGIDNLMQQNQQLTSQDAANRLLNLDPAQVRGVVELGLLREQVQTPNFDNTTIETINELVQNQRAENRQQAFAIVSGLNNRQTTGIRRGLEREDVTTPNFDIHTLFGIDMLRARANNNISHRDAFQTLRELNAVQVRGITDLHLNREQVQNSRFNNDMIKSINRLKRLNRRATNDYLYNAAMNLPEYQIRGVVQLGLNAEQVGLAVVNNEFVQLNPENQRVANGQTIDAIDYLVANDFMNAQEAYDFAMNLNTEQTLAMTEFGLSPEMIQTSDFLGTYNVLNELAAPITRTGSELNLPLSQEEKSSLQDDISRSGSIQNLSSLYQSAEEEKSSSEQSNTETAAILPYAAAPAAPADTETLSSDDKKDLSALTRVKSLNSIAEMSDESHTSRQSDKLPTELRKPNRLPVKKLGGSRRSRRPRKKGPKK